DAPVRGRSAAEVVTSWAKNPVTTELKAAGGFHGQSPFQSEAGPGGTMKTRQEVEKAAHLLGDERWKVWMNCGVHDWRTLPETDSGEHYCEKCWTCGLRTGGVAARSPRPASW